MRSKGQRFFALLLIGVGLIMLAGNLFDFNVSELFWPLVLILVGIWFVFRPGLSNYGQDVVMKFVGEINRDGNWQVADEELWMFVGELDFDFSEAEIPEGETSIRILAFVSELDLRLPENVGLSISSNAFVVNANIFGDRQEFIFNGMNYLTDNYDSAERKIRFEITSFVSELKVI